MKKVNLSLQIILILACNSCSTNSNQTEAAETNLFKEKITVTTENLISPSDTTIETRFSPPEGYKRIRAENNSFAEYLRNLPLKPQGSLVKYYEGTNKPNNNTYEAVVNLPIGNKDLHQCADAIMRLRAEYLWQQKEFEKIHFNFTNGFRVDYTEWMNGKRIIVNGNKTSWSASGSPSNTYNDFWKYLEIIFTYAGSLSLSMELKAVNINEMQIGDIFIQGGTPGHAVIVVDMAEDVQTGKKLFMLAQSYMPAQEIQILQNVDDKSISPWYQLEFHHELHTPEWLFYKTDLKRFNE